jgi:dTDP-4-dehydrorhamnose reductase
MTGLPVASRGKTKSMNARSRETRPLAITGATGTLGQAFARLCRLRGLAYRLSSRQDMDVADRASVAAALDARQPWALVNTAGYVRVDQAEQEPERCFRENVEGPAILAEACARRGIPLVTFSSDLVFDGQKGSPYVESDPAAPLSVYGRSKAAAEQRVLATHPDALVVRTSAFFGPWDEHNFVTIALRRLAERLPFVAATDQVISPTYVPDLVHTCLDLLLDRERGIWHVANPGAFSWLDLAQQAAEMAGIDTATLEGRPTATLGLAAAKPLYSVLASERATLLPPTLVALERYFHDCREAGVDWRADADRRAAAPATPPSRESVA